MLDGIADPRKLRGIRHKFSAVLTVMVLAVLAGGRNFREIADCGAELPPDLLTLAGCRVHPVTGQHLVPSAATIRGVAHGIDADAADEQVSAWLRTEALASTIAQGTPGERTDTDGSATTLVAVAMDGKTIRNTIQPGGTQGQRDQAVLRVRLGGPRLVPTDQGPPLSESCSLARARRYGLPGASSRREKRSGVGWRSRSK
jgi:hypothetical protein